MKNLKELGIRLYTGNYYLIREDIDKNFAGQIVKIRTTDSKGICCYEVKL